MAQPVEYRFCPRCAAALLPRRLKPGEPERLACAGCGFIFFLDPKLAACTICPLDGGIVLVRRSIEPGYGKWVIPGGHVDRGEAVVAAAIRETLEETSLEVAIRELVNVYSYPGNAVVVVVYVAHTSGPVTGQLTCTFAGLVQDALATGVIGIGGLAKTIVGFFTGIIGTQFIVVQPLPRFVV
ncbi:MAG: NUDIX domain-containing protein, partial [Candidatus Methylomirabilales bacterium]